MGAGVKLVSEGVTHALRLTMEQKKVQEKIKKGKKYMVRKRNLYNVKIRMK